MMMASPNESDGNRISFTCVLCNQVRRGLGENSYPVHPTKVCCYACYAYTVFPARAKAIPGYSDDGVSVQQALQVLETYGETGTVHSFATCMRVLCCLDSSLYIRYAELRQSIVQRLQELANQRDIAQYVKEFADKMIDDVYFTDDFEEGTLDLDHYDFLVSIATNK